MAGDIGANPASWLLQLLQLLWPGLLAVTLGMPCCLDPGLSKCCSACPAFVQMHGCIWGFTKETCHRGHRPCCGWIVALCSQWSTHKYPRLTPSSPPAMVLNLLGYSRMARARSDNCCVGGSRCARGSSPIDPWRTWRPHRGDWRSCGGNPLHQGNMPQLAMVEHSQQRLQAFRVMLCCAVPSTRDWPAGSTEGSGYLNTDVSGYGTAYKCSFHDIRPRRHPIRRFARRRLQVDGSCEHTS